MTTRDNLTKVCTVRCQARTAHVPPVYRRDMKCEAVPGGWRCLGSCRAMKSVAFGRGRPLFDAAWIIVAVHPPESSNVDINLVNNPPAPPATNNPPGTVGFFTANWINMTEYQFTVQSTVQSLPRIGFSSSYEQPRFTTTSPLRYGAPMHILVDGVDMVTFQGRPTVINACNSTRQNGYEGPGEACIFARPWIIRAPGGDQPVFPNGDIVREHDRFLLEDAYAYGREKRFLTWVPPVPESAQCSLIDPDDPDSGYAPGCGAAQPGYFKLADRQTAMLFSAALAFQYQKAEPCLFTEDVLMQSEREFGLAPGPAAPATVTEPNGQVVPAALAYPGQTPATGPKRLLYGKPPPEPITSTDRMVRGVVAGILLVTLGLLVHTARSQKRAAASATAPVLPALVQPPPFAGL